MSELGLARLVGLRSSSKSPNPPRYALEASLMPAHHPVHLAIRHYLSKSIFWEVNFPNFAVA